MKIAMVMDRWELLKPYKDTSLLLLEAAHQRGHALFYIEAPHLKVLEGVPWAMASLLEAQSGAFAGFAHGSPAALDLRECDLIFMRKDPPFDLPYIYNTYVLELAERQGVRVINRPAALRDCNEKFFISHFPQCCAPTLISARMQDIEDFFSVHQDIILKPLDGMGGMGILRIRADAVNLFSAIELLTHNGTVPIMAQQFIPEISAGDKRILLIDGEPLPYALARIPLRDLTRGNLAAGGRGEVQPLTADDFWICSQIAPTLVERGLRFVGIDVIGRFLTEINVTSPTCLREIENEVALYSAQHFIERLELEQEINPGL